MADQSDGLSSQEVHEGEKRQKREMDTAAMSASRAHPSTTQSILQQVAQQASMLPEFLRNLTGGAPQSSLREATAEDHDRGRGGSNGIIHDREPEKSPLREVDHLRKEKQELNASRTVGVNASEPMVQENAGIPDHRGDGNILGGYHGSPQGFTRKDELPPSQMEVQDLPGEEPIPRIQAFAKLEFDDGEFYMNTYSVELGRDIRAARLAYDMENDDSHVLETKRRRRSDSGLDGSQASNKARRDDGRHLAGSVISESGGIVGVGAHDADSRRRSRGEKSKSTTSSSQQLSRKSSMHVENRLTDYQSLAMASLRNFEPGILHTSPLEVLPAPDACPLVPIHPPTNAEGLPAGHKSISRKHIRIAFNFEKRLFEVTILGRNGAFVEDQYIPVGGVQPLKSGHTIQIGVVKVRFLLPDVAIGSTGAEALDINDPTGDFMCFDFEDGVEERGGYEERGIRAWSSESGSEEENNEEDNREDDGESREVGENEDDEEVHSGASEAEVPQVDDGEDQEDEEGEKGEKGEEEDEEGEDVEEPEQRQKPVRPKPKPKPRARGKGRGKGKGRGRGKTRLTTTGKAKAKPSTKPQPTLEPGQPVPKRKGPGRPPKNGIISKREQALLARMAREEAKAAALKESSAQAEEGKRTSATEANQKQEDGVAQPRVKRKYTKRKSKDAQSGEVNGVRESTEHTDSISPEQGLAQIPQKVKRPSKRPRSPSPVYDESQMTPEQLAKPTASYVVLIHEALSNSKTGALSLSQIYRAIERKYPYYKLRVQTTGWQSSVRHNLSQHDAFKKIERDGKGWMWGLVPEVSIEKEKKRRPSPPTMQPQQYYQQGPPHMINNPYLYAGMPPPNGHLPPHMNHPPYGMPPGQMPFPPPGLLPPPLGPNGLPLPLVNVQADSSSTYQSPYQSAPPVQPPVQPPQPPPPPPPSYTNGYNGYYQANIPHPPPPPGQVSTNHPPHPTSSPTPYPAHPPNPSPGVPPPNINTSNNNTNNSNKNSISTDVLQAVSQFKDALIKSMDNNSHTEALVSSAINRTLYPQSSSVTAEDEDPEEKAIMKALVGMLDKLNKKSHDTHHQASQPPQSGLASSFQKQQPSNFSPIVEGLPPPQLPQPPPPLSQQQGAQAYSHQMHHIGDHYPRGGTPSQIHPGALNVPTTPGQLETSAPAQQPEAELLPGKATEATSLGTNDVAPAIPTPTIPEIGGETVKVKRVGGKRKLEEDEAGDNKDREAKKVNSGDREGGRSSPKKRPNNV